jgi:hypothetical protein
MARGAALHFRRATCHIGRAMLHLVKLAVGARDVEHLRATQAARIARQETLRHRTRNRPRRAAEVVDGGSLYWVVSGAVLVRQRITDIVEDHWEDGSKCSGLILDPVLVSVAGRPMKPFQGWRYLAAADAPADLDAMPEPEGGADLPAALRRELVALCLI